VVKPIGLRKPEPSSYVGSNPTLASIAKYAVRKPHCNGPEEGGTQAMTTKAVTVKLSAELYETAADIAHVTKSSFREFVSVALEREIKERFANERGSELQATLERMREFRGA
jgi:hypothetical protein